MSDVDAQQNKTAGIFADLRRRFEPRSLTGSGEPRAVPLHSSFIFVIATRTIAQHQICVSLDSVLTGRV